MAEVKDDVVGPKQIQDAKSATPKSIRENIATGAILNNNEPELLIKAGEKVIKGDSNNSGIILGRDSPNGYGTGESAVGNTNCSSIEIVVGRGTAIADQRPPSGKLVDASTYYDAAKIYISERTNIDSAFNYRGVIPGTSEYQSAIALKADQVRLFSRGHTIISSGMDNIPKASATRDPKAPQFKKRDHSGIYLVANNTGGLQPLVKGQNLQEYLQKMSDQIIILHSLVAKFIEYQQEYNRRISEHRHKSEIDPEGGMAYQSPELELAMSLHDSFVSSDCYQKLSDSVNTITSFKNNYLTDGNKSINSKYNKTN